MALGGPTVQWASALRSAGTSRRESGSLRQPQGEELAPPRHTKKGFPASLAAGWLIPCAVRSLCDSAGLSFGVPTAFCKSANQGASRGQARALAHVSARAVAVPRAFCIRSRRLRRLLHPCRTCRPVNPASGTPRPSCGTASRWPAGCTNPGRSRRPTSMRHFAWPAQQASPLPAGPSSSPRSGARGSATRSCKSPPAPRSIGLRPPLGCGPPGYYRDPPPAAVGSCRDSASRSAPRTCPLPRSQSKVAQLGPRSRVPWPMR